MYSSPVSRLASTATNSTGYRMQRQQTANGDIYTEKWEAATVTVLPHAPRVSEAMSPVRGMMVKTVETRETLPPTAFAPQSVAQNVRSEDMPATMVSRGYETIRRDPYTLFPGANIVRIARLETPVTTALGTVFDPNTNTFYSRLTNTTSPVTPLMATGAPSVATMQSTGSYLQRSY